jgi:endonuclease-3
MLMKNAINILRDRGNELAAKPYQRIEFTHNLLADDLLNDITNYPHAFVLACVMDRQIKAERAWLIPYKFSQEIGGFEFSKLSQLDSERINSFFISNSGHRFKAKMADNFYHAIRDIGEQYQGNAANLWSNTPKSGTVVRRFLRFKGVGIKIATMAANILFRDFKIPMADKNCIDISPDVQVKRVFSRLGLIGKDSKSEAELIYCARELNPEYPGVFDFHAWEIGEKWCRPNNPLCGSCYLESQCPKSGVTQS